MYMAMADDRLEIQREPVRMVGMGRLGFAPILAAAGAAGGPAGWVVAGVGAAIMGIGAAIKAIFHTGHGDDKVGEADGVALGQIVAPLLSEFLGGISVAGTWMDVDPKTDMLFADVIKFENGQGTSVPFYKMTADRAAQLLNWGDGAVAEACKEFAAAGYPCHLYVQGKSGAGTLLFTKWNRLRPVIERAVALLRQTESAGLSYAQEMERAAAGQPLQATWDPTQQPTQQTAAIPAAGGVATTAGSAVQSVETWFSGKTVIGGQPIPNMMLAAGAGLALAWAVSK